MPKSAVMSTPAIVPRRRRRIQRSERAASHFYLFYISSNGVEFRGRRVWMSWALGARLGWVTSATQGKRNKKCCLLFSQNDGWKYVECHSMGGVEWLRDSGRTGRREDGAAEVRCKRDDEQASFSPFRRWQLPGKLMFWTRERNADVKNQGPGEKLKQLKMIMEVEESPLAREDNGGNPWGTTSNCKLKHKSRLRFLNWRKDGFVRFERIRKFWALFYDDENSTVLYIFLYFGKTQNCFDICWLFSQLCWQ